MTLADLAARVSAALAPLASPLTIRELMTFQAKAATLAPIGATTVTLTPPAGMSGVLAGDTFSVGGPATKTISAPAAVSGGAITATFSPALTSAVQAGASVPVTRAATHTCRGWEETADLRSSAELVKLTDRVFMVLADSLPVAPSAGQQLVTAEGETLTIRHASRDGIAAAWRVVAGR